MAKVVITIQDQDEESINIEMVSDPPFPGSGKKHFTDAQYYAMIGMDAMVRKGQIMKLAIDDKEMKI